MRMNCDALSRSHGGGPSVCVLRYRCPDYPSHIPKQLRAGTSRFNAVVVLAVAALLLLAGATIWYVLVDDGGKQNDHPVADNSLVSLEMFRQAVEAVAATEEADFRRATQRWDELIQAQPTNNTFKLNQAITVLKWISDINAEIGSGQANPQELEQLNEELRDAYLEVESIIDTLAKSDINDYRAAFVEAALLEMKALRADAEPTLRKQALDILAAQLQNVPGELLLAVKFEELASQLEVEYPELMKDRANVLYDAFVKNPRNLFVLKSAAEALLREKDPRLQELLAPSVDLARPMLNAPMVARLVERLKPDELVVDVAAAVEQGDWAKARRITPWLNTLVSLSGFKPDAKLAKPDVLAILETGFLTEMAMQVHRDETAPEQNIVNLSTFEELVLSPTGVTAAAWYDADFDLDFDVVAASDASLRFYDCIDAQIRSEPTSVVEVGMAVQGILPVDMFEVQLPGRPLPPGTVAELMQANNAPPKPLTAEQIAQALRHDTLQELLLWGEAGMRVVTLDATDTFVLLDAPTGLEGFREVTKVVPVDFESDGDLDLAIVNSGQIHLMQNNGNRVFVEISEYSSLPDGCCDLTACDFDHDTDQDFLVLDPSQSQVVLLENILHSQFRARPLEGELWQTAEDAVAIAVADLDNNASWDVVTLGESGARATYTRKLARSLPAARTAIDFASAGQSLAIDDLNNDGELEIVTGGATGLNATSLPRPDSGSTNADPGVSLGLQGKQVTGISVLDFNGDGELDVLAVAGEAATVCQTDQEFSEQFMLVRVAGINDDNGGGRVNHFGVGSTLEVWAEGEHFSRRVKYPTTHFGLGKRQPDNLRIVFPNGLTQNLEKPEPQSLIEEKQVPRGSCPYAYGWDGERFVMITDLLWNAPLGLQYARGEVLPDRRWEYLLLPGEWMQPRDGAYELRVTEELWEVAYFDHIQLTAIDHPADIRVFTNEKVGPPQIAAHEIFAAEQRIEPVRATDSRGRNVLRRIRSKDGDVVQAFDRQICQGLCEPHFVELDFGTLPVNEQHLRLFLTGWMYPTDTSLNIGIDQNPDRAAPEPPSLWVVDKSGQWVCAQPFMGFPGGKTKSIVIDLADVFQSDDHRLRIGTSQQLYWDEAFVSWHAGDDKVRQQVLNLSSADLHYRGFSELLPRTSDQPHWFDYQRLVLDASWPALEGPFTRFGDVKPILEADDDRMVVMVSGDEIALRFEPPAVDLPNGWRRDFVMHSTGWDKDADLNTIEGQGSLPLPFKDQTAYPAAPEQIGKHREVWQKNADTLTRIHQIDPTKSQAVGSH